MTLYPNNADVFYYFAYVFYKEGDIDSPRKYLEKTFNVNQEHTFAKQLLDLLNKNDADKYSNQIISAFEAQFIDQWIFEGESIFASSCKTILLLSFSVLNPLL